uniref:Uncharacterized protein n=1 Tax=Aeromonas salmonicida subsp. salmonicida TaxID=29491 RepID=A0A1I9S276_AERSS|nr:putative hypothetical protein [Aeromonas salmonicida subsp. salmonicida]
MLWGLNTKAGSMSRRGLGTDRPRQEEKPLFTRALLAGQGYPC